MVSAPLDLKIDSSCKRARGQAQSIKTYGRREDDVKEEGLTSLWKGNLSATLQGDV